MTTKAQAIAELERLGFRLDETVTSYSRLNGFATTFDPIGRKCIAGDCRGEHLFDYTATAAEFWAEVAERARELAPLLEPCPFAVGECDYHDEGLQP
jgi:hypothetical protein